MPAARSCQQCGGAVHPRQRYCLCPDCRKKVCNRCREPLPDPYGARTCPCCRRTDAPGALAGVACRECGDPVKGTAKRDLCPVCRRRFCTTCDQPLPVGRKAEQCLLCVRDYNRRRTARKDRRCSDCGLRAPTAGGIRCSECAHEQYILARLCSLRQPPRACVDCGELMPRGRIATRCTDCLRERTEAREVGRSCAACRQRQRQKGSAYCNPCELLRKNWTHAVHRGDKTAALVRPLAPRRRWQAQDGIRPDTISR